MPETFYSVKEGNTVLAKNMTLTDALLFTEALFNKYFGQVGMAITIVREENSLQMDAAEACLTYEKNSKMAF